jgi:surface protein
MKSIRKNKKGVSLIEYGMLLGLIASLAIASVLGLGGALNELFYNNDSVFGSHMTSAQLPEGEEEEEEESPSALTLEINTALASMVGGLTYSVGLKDASGVVIDWGAGDANGSCQTSFSGTVVASCSYPTPGAYTVSIEGSLSGIGVFDPYLAGRSMLTAVSSWGSAPITNLEYAFLSANNLVNVPNELPTGVTTMKGMFEGADAFNQDISGWDTSSVTTMESMFESADAFNGDVSGWDTSSVTRMNRMFDRASDFNQDISGWDTSSVTTMVSMFSSADAFNGDISGWDTSSVIYMTMMFRSAYNFNQDLSGWCVTNLTSLPALFDTSANAWVLPRPIWGTCP